MAGDQVSATVLYYAPSTAKAPTNNSLATTVVTNLLSVLTAGGPATGMVKGNASGVTTQLSGSNNNGFTGLPTFTNASSGTPQAYLTVLFFDERFNFIGVSDGGAVSTQIPGTTAAGGAGSSVTIPPTKAPKNGYAYVYVSNRSDQDVFFDNLKVQVQQGNIIEENHYYAYGLKIAPISSVKLGDGGEGGLQNNYQYQGNNSELDADIGWNDFELRNYDPQVGRWVQQDPYYEFPSPYVGMGMDPINNTDPDGGGVLGLTPGLFTALTTSMGAIIGGDVAAATGGSFIKGAAVGAAIGFAAGYIPSLIRGGVGSTVSHAISILNVSVHAVGVVKDFTNTNGGVKSVNWTSKWNFYTHQDANYNAIRTVDNNDVYSVWYEKLMALDEGTEYADSKQFQNGSNSFRHAMRDEDTRQPPQQAKQLADAFVRAQFDKAIKLLNRGKTQDAYYQFSIGLHVLQDATSPSHSGFQPWGDNVSMWRIFNHIIKECAYPGEKSNLQKVTNYYYSWFENPNRPPLPKENLFDNIHSD